ncbi:MAG: hypothetical protein L3K23_02660 [Thermoplasmata archaeon]|nr:hypothetical protein [Thermoplasmata archaeon]
MPKSTRLRSEPHRRWKTAVALTVLALAVPSLLSIGATAATGGAVVNSRVVTFANTCGTASGPTPAALYIHSKNPTVTLSAGDTMTVVYEFMVSGFTSAVVGEAVHIPSVQASFPLSNGTTLPFLLLHRVIVIQNGSWTDPSLATDTKAIKAAYTFANPGNATLSSQKIAIMASNSAYGNLTLEFRWMWTVNQSANGHGVTIGPWTHPTSHAFPPSIFEPAPLVNLASRNGPTVTIGAVADANLTGAISSTSFLVELEYSSGDVFNTVTEKTPAGNATPFRAHILMMSVDNNLAPTKALLHVHDHCGAIIYSLSEVAVYNASAVLRIDVAPSTCGPVTFNGTAYANRSSVVLAPSTTSYAISVGACAGHTFVGWEGNNGVDPDPIGKLSASVVVSADGTLTAKFL